MNEYTHWLVTIGNSPGRFRGKRITPLVLSPVEAGFGALTKLVRDRVHAINTCLLTSSDKPFDILRVSSDVAAINLATDLWLSQVRLSSVESNDPDEVSIRWAIVKKFERPPAWQGIADHVIPHDKPVTISHVSSQPSPFKILDD